MNMSCLVGRLTKDPQEIEISKKDTRVCKLNLAVNENYTKEDGTRPVQFFNIAVWGKLAENCLKYLTKGSQISVIGKLQNRSWEDADGIKRYAVEVVANEIEFLSIKKEEKEDKEEKPKFTPIDDDLPF